MNPENKPPITWIQIYTACFSTVSCIFLGIIVNFMWEMKEWKGTKDEVDRMQTDAISNITSSIGIATKERQGIKDRVTALEAIKPKERRHLTDADY